LAFTDNLSPRKDRRTDEARRLEQAFEAGAADAAGAFAAFTAIAPAGSVTAVAAVVSATTAGSDDGDVVEVERGAAQQADAGDTRFGGRIDFDRVLMTRHERDRALFRRVRRRPFDRRGERFLFGSRGLVEQVRGVYVDYLKLSTLIPSFWTLI
jgi:hypothetical protein